MSEAGEGRQIRCDGPGCSAAGHLPVALRPVLARPGERRAAADGWLFIAGDGGRRHFCPRCARRHLAGLLTD